MRLRSAPTPTTPRRPIRPQGEGAAPQLDPRPGAAPAARAAQRRRGPSRTVLLIAVAVAALLAGGAAAVWLTLPTVEPTEPAELTADATPLLELDVTHPGGLGAGDVHATIDGDAVDASAVRVLDGGTRVQVQAPELEDGEHDAHVRLSGLGLLHRTQTASWSFTVDTTAPAMRIVAPPGEREGASDYVPAGVIAVTKHPLRLTVGAEPGTTLDVTSSAPGEREPVHVEPSKDTRRTVEVTLPEGAGKVTVVATDPAGNTTTRSRGVVVDTTGPVVFTQTPKVVKDRSLQLPISARDLHGVSLQVKLDGRDVTDSLEQQAAVGPPDAQQPSGDDADEEAGEQAGAGAPAATCASSDDQDSGGDEGDEETAQDEDCLDPVSGRWVLALDEGAYEGRHVLQVDAIDSLGTTSTTKRVFVVDSTEDLGAAAGLRGGSRGADVAQLHAALLEQSATTKAALGADLTNRAYGAATRTAVTKFQNAQGMEADGIAGSDTIAALTLKIVVDRAAHRLTLYRVGKVVKSWGVAVGSPQYPTPAGDFEIQSMQKDPTWTPPDSEWAKDAKVIPPGPDNPLGTRWMAIDGTVGIHGTNSPSSIGFSVSHGCIRMAIPDVEELFDMVAIGTRVSVV